MAKITIERKDKTRTYESDSYMVLLLDNEGGLSAIAGGDSMAVYGMLNVVEERMKLELKGNIAHIIRDDHNAGLY